jgi:hypothetical protein
MLCFEIGTQLLILTTRRSFLAHTKGALFLVAKCVAPGLQISPNSAFFSAKKMPGDLGSTVQVSPRPLLHPIFGVFFLSERIVR